MKVLFICLGNTCRSPMAEAWLNYIAQKEDLNIQAESAGTWGYDGGAQRHSIEIIKEKTGKNMLAKFLSRKIDMMDLEPFDLILTMQKDIIDEIPGKNVFNLLDHVGIGGDVEDPHGGGRDTYMAAFNQIEAGINLLLKKWRNEGKA